MNIRLLLLPTLVLVALTGCRKDPYVQVYIDNMNAEKRLLEDTLYDLQYDYDDKLAEVEKLRQELETLKTGSVNAPSPSGTTSPRAERGEPRTLFPDIPNLTPPTIEEGIRSDPDGPKKSGIGEDPDDLEPPQLDLGDAADDVSVIPMPLDEQITELHLDAARTGGFQRDELAGDDGIVVVFQPRNAQHDFVPQPGRVNVVLLDPETRARVALWEFTESETELALQKAGSQRGIELTMPWTETPPQKSRLHLFVRFWLPDGQAVQEDREITIAPTGQLAARWTPRSRARPEPPSHQLEVADRHGESTSSSIGQEAEPKPKGGWEAPSNSDGSEASIKQARRPTWRPYR